MPRPAAGPGISNGAPPRSRGTGRPARQSEGAELGGHRGAAQRRRQVEEALLAGVAEAPQRGHHPHHHGGQHVLHEQRAGDQLHHRGGREQRQQPEGRRAAHPSPHREVEHRLQQQQQHVIEQVRRVFAAHQVYDGVREIGAHGHHRPHEPAGLKRHRMVGGDIGGDGQVHGQPVGAGLRHQRHEPMRQQHEHHRREGRSLGVAAQFGGAQQLPPAHQAPPCAAPVEQHRDRQQSRPDRRVVHRNPRHQVITKIHTAVPSRVARSCDSGASPCLRPSRREPRAHEETR